MCLAPWMVCDMRADLGGARLRSSPEVRRRQLERAPSEGDQRDPCGIRVKRQVVERLTVGSGVGYVGLVVG
jgi:hypothetical protein